MAGMHTLQMMKTIPNVDDSNYVNWARPFNEFLQISWTFLSKIISGLEKPEPILRSRELEDSNEDRENDPVNIDEREPSGVIDDIWVWDSADEHLLSVLRFNNNKCSPKRTVTI